MHPTALSAARDPASPQTVLEVCWKLPQSVVGTVVTALVAGVALVLVKLLNDKLRRYLPMPIPGELLTVRTPGQGRGGGQGRVHPCWWAPLGFRDQLDWAPGSVPGDGV